MTGSDGNEIFRKVPNVREPWFVEDVAATPDAVNVTVATRPGADRALTSGPGSGGPERPERPESELPDNAPENLRKGTGNRNRDRGAGRK